ncbi:MAG: hypothetical protein A2Y23_00955 [Clostridiales bacterium GWB2_37_7]|nr:MAG: hypothetical protein A2Y23_00955 [Clostridiales bacterium GWB2_37_7]
MNDKFFKLSDEKQKAIINAGCKGFFKYGYRKVSMSEIAMEAGISKALLFHYFKNKKEFYLYLFAYALELTRQFAKEEISISETDLFEIFMQSARIKSRLLRQHAHLSRFMMSAYYEVDEEVAKDIKAKTNVVTANSIESILVRMDRRKLKDEINVEELVRIILWCGEGYMKEKYYDEQLDIDKIQAGYAKMLYFFRQSCYKDQYRKSQFDE